VALVRGRLMDELKPDGFNIGDNDGPAAGQTVLHAHVHVIPRRTGDVADPKGGIRWVVPAKGQYGVEEQR
jgi:diadenosine tetraphosphate (Ap4A) HIT family hydrolase